MSWRVDLMLGILSGLLVPVIAAAVQFGWTRRRVPTALVRSVRRQSYLSAVLAESMQRSVAGLDVLAPRMTPAVESRRMIGSIQSAWQRIDEVGAVRVVTLDSEDCVKAGAELLVRGIEVRVTRREFGKESLSYHLFRAPDQTVATALLNHHEGGKDRPVRLNGGVTTQVFQDHFTGIWESASPLESVLAQRIVEKAGDSPNRSEVVDALDTVAKGIGLDRDCVERILPHMAFRHGSSVIFVVGLPGSGKSLVRRMLAELLGKMSIKTIELTDYVFAYRDFLHGLLQLDPRRGEGFEPHDGGAFSVRHETSMIPALQALAREVQNRGIDSEVTLVEFARADLVAALQEFDDIRARSRVIYVSAPEQLRVERITRRAEQPETAIEDSSIKVALSDNHFLPSSVERTIYGLDDIERLASSRRWGDRVFRIENAADDNGIQIDERLRAFVEELIDHYRSGRIYNLAHPAGGAPPSGAPTLLRTPTRPRPATSRHPATTAS